MRKISLVGQRFHKLLVIEDAEPKRDPSGQLKQWSKCQCDCGKVLLVRNANLTSNNGNTTSCGCHREAMLKSWRGRANLRHGQAGKRTSEYSTWVGMIARCTNPNVENWCYYGGLGIMVCDEWRNSFAVFFNDMGPKPSPQHSLDRISVSLGYSKENCRWATKKEQIGNRRKIAAISEFTTDELLHELAKRKSQLTASHSLLLVP